MKRIRVACALCVVAPLWSQARSAVNAAGRADRITGLPVKRVVLYKNGVGFFEHVGSVRGNEAVTISFTSDQLNDVLKSLTVLDLNGGRIAGVSYGTSAPVERQLKDLHLPAGDKASIADFLEALRGTRLEVKSGAVLISGRLLSVERKNRISGAISSEIDTVSLITGGGDLRTAELSSASSVRLLEPGLAGKVTHFLDVMAAGREADVRRMVIATEGAGQRQLYVSYISEVPVWKSTYRIVLNDKPGASALLQAWAIVDNTVGENWENVQLSLVAGAPQSFIQDLSQPYYSHRPIVPLPENVSTTPQTHQGTLTTSEAQLSGSVKDAAGGAISGAIVKAFDANGNAVGERATDASGAYQLESLPDGPLRLSISAPGFQTAELAVTAPPGKATEQDARLNVGDAAETVSVDGAPPPPPPALPIQSALNGRVLGTGSSLGRSGPGSGEGNGYGPGSGHGMGGGAYRIRTQSNAAAQAAELGDLFEYKLKDPITIEKNRSALVPVAQSTIDVEKVSLWNEQAGLQRPQRALWLTNSSGLTLDGGSVSVLEDETFSGEGIIDSLRPAEKRLLSYATDLALNVRAKGESEPQRVTRVVIAHGVMTQESEVREKKTYTFRNEDTSDRTVIVEHPVRTDYELRSQAKPVETTASWQRFRLLVASKQTASLVVEEARPSKAVFYLSNITPDQVDVFVTQRSIDPTIREALQKILAQKSVIAGFENAKNTRAAETQKIFDDQQRLRENIKALTGTPEEKPLLHRYTEQLNNQETRLAALSQETAQLQKQADSANAELNRMIQDLSFSVSL